MPQMIIPDELKKIFEKVDSVVFETAGKEGNQNAVQVFWKRVLNDKTVLLIGDFTKLNEKDLIEDNDVRISYWDPEEEKGYQIKGIGRYPTDGSIYKVRLATKPLILHNTATLPHNLPHITLRL